MPYWTIGVLEFIMEMGRSVGLRRWFRATRQTEHCQPNAPSIGIDSEVRASVGGAHHLNLTEFRVWVRYEAVSDMKLRNRYGQLEDFRKHRTRN